MHSRLPFTQLTLKDLLKCITNYAYVGNSCNWVVLKRVESRMFRFDLSLTTHSLTDLHYCCRGVTEL